MENCNLRKLLWGSILEPQHSFRYKCGGRKLHLTQATLSPSSDVNNRVMVKCCRQEGPTLYICSLRTGSVESVFLDLIINEDAEFSITGSTSVHLLGYFICNDDELEERDYFSHDECSYSADEDSYDSDFVVNDDVVEYEEDHSKEEDIGGLQGNDEENSPVKPRKRLRRLAEKEEEIFKTKSHDENGTQVAIGGLSFKKKKEKTERLIQDKERHVEEVSSPKKKRRTVERSSTGNTNEGFDHENKKEKEKKKQKKSAKRRDATT